MAASWTSICDKPCRPNAASVWYEATEVETYAVRKANFIANFNIYSDI